ncbi:unnamed protein product [Auanema sp. JU1783]|nr:unnamed protein product [Auanema sp. JU1783]
MHCVVDPREYRSFCFRGEGRANLVISAKSRDSGTRIVWRFSKARKSGLITLKAKSELVNRYMENMITPFFSSNYLVAPRIVGMSVADVHQIAKIPSLLSNIKIESFGELKQLPDELSLLPLSNVPKGCSTITALEMLDATRIPQQITSYIGPTITVEIKPKQGFFQIHPGVRLPYCNNCILQIEKCGSDHFTQMYDFCPLDLFSGVHFRVCRSLRELFRNPHRNLRLFVNGNLLFSNEAPASDSTIKTALFPHDNGNIEDLVSALALILTGSPSVDSFGLYKNSVLDEILAGQQIDSIGIIRAHKLFKNLPQEDKNYFMEKARLPSLDDFLHKTDAKSLIERYLLAATMKDCSVMVSVRLVPSHMIQSSTDYNNIVRLPNGLCFSFSVKIVDLDPKSPKNLLNAISRFITGVKIMKLENCQRRPCFQE